MLLIAIPDPVNGQQPKQARFADTATTPASAGQPAKCGLPLIRQYLNQPTSVSPDAATRVRRYLDHRTTAQNSYLSVGGKFEIHYDTEGEDAVPPVDLDPNNGIPDYVERVAQAADSSWRHQVQTLGHTDPLAGLNGPYPITLRNITDYGFTLTDPETGTAIVIENDFNGAFPENSDPEGKRIGAMKVTVAHELKHAIQFANSEWYGWLEGDPQSPHSTSWSEMDATLMEELVYDNVNDYYNYIDDAGSLFLAGDHRIPASYQGVTWPLYFSERFGNDFWPAVWERIETRYREQAGLANPDYLTMMEAISATLQEDYQTGLDRVFPESHLWHLAAGSRYSSPGFGFEERQEYPDPYINDGLIAKDDLAGSPTLPTLGAHYVTVTPHPQLVGTLEISGTFEHEATQIGVIGYFTDGSTRTLVEPGGASGSFHIAADWNWSNLSEIGLVVTNSSQDVSPGFSLSVSADTDVLVLTQNYPNPFNPVTKIQFALPEPTDVLLTVYDATGRKVRTLIDERRESGYHLVRFEGEGLASGIYFYRIRAGERTVVKKMTLIK